MIITCKILYVIIVIYLSFVKIEILYFPNLLVSFKVRCLDLACFFNLFVLWLFVFVLFHTLAIFLLVCCFVFC